ncbi:putative electron transfer flavoprotein subunit [Entomortierella beljakovae]|nr:putative electron transfer flavoprotein subunit [Entomortierella beljakovae]
MSLAETAPVVAAAAAPSAPPAVTTDSDQTFKLSQDTAQETVINDIVMTSISSSLSVSSISTSVSLSAAMTFTDSSIISIAPNQSSQTESEEKQSDAQIIDAQSSSAVSPLSPSPSVSGPTSLNKTETEVSIPTAIETTKRGSDTNSSNDDISSKASGSISAGRTAPTPTSLPPSPSAVTSMAAIDKGLSIPTSNALSSSLRSRLSSSAPLSSLSSATPTTIISPKPFTSSHAPTAPLTSMSKADFTHYPPGSNIYPTYSIPTSKPNGQLITNSNSSLSTQQSGERYSKIDQQRLISDENDGDDDDDSEGYYEEGDEYEVIEGESDIELDNSELDLEMEEGDSEMIDISAEPSSPQPSVHGLSTQAIPSRKRLASPGSPTTIATEDSSISGSTLKTLSPQLTPEQAEQSGLAQSNKNIGNGLKKENKAGVTTTSCANCGTTSTPLWRRATDGQTICNACGLYFKARNLKRPPWLKRNMGLKKSESTSESDNLDPKNQSSQLTTSALAADTAEKSSDGVKTLENDEKLGATDNSDCPGDGSCTGTAGITCSHIQQRPGRQHLVCANCHTVTTPLWRRDGVGNTICNACGLYYKLHNVHRPVTMMRAIIKRRKRVNVMTTNSPPLVSQTQQQQQQQQHHHHQQQSQQPPPPTQQNFHQPPPQYHQRLQYPRPLQRPRTPPPTSVDQSGHETQGDLGNAAKRRRLQGSNGSNGAPEDYMMANRNANNHPEWGRRDQNMSGYRRSMSPAENIGGGGGDPNHHQHGSPHHQGSYPNRSLDPRGHMYLGQPRYMMNQHFGNGHYHSSPSMSMSRYPSQMPPPPPPSSSRTHQQHPHQQQQPPPPPPSAPSSSQQHPHGQPQHHMHQQPAHGYPHPEHSPREMDDGMHASSQHSSGWNQHLPGYSTTSSSSANARPPTGAQPGGPPPASPGYPRYPQEPPSPYHHQQPYRAQNQQGHEYHPSEPQPQGGQPPPQSNHHYSSGNSPTQSSIGSSSSGYNYHHATNTASNEGPMDREHSGMDNGGQNPAHLQPIHHGHQNHHPIHQREQGPPAHHHQYGQHRRQPSPPIAMNGPSNHAAPAPAVTSVPAPVPPTAMPGMGSNADVLQQTRQDLQREVTHLSMLLGRAAAVLSGLDQALDPHHPNPSGSPPVPHSIRESGSPVGHGYNPPGGAPQHGHNHGHAPPQSHTGAPPMANDVTTGSALASLMTLSSSGGPGRPNAVARHDERDMQHMQSAPLPPLQHQQQLPPPPRSTEWKSCITQGLTALKSARTSTVRAIEDFTAVVDQVQDIASRMTRIRQKLINTIQQASPPGIMGIEAILKAQEEAREIAEAKEKNDEEMDSDSEEEQETDSMSKTTFRGYVPPPELVNTLIPGTKATPLDMFNYIDHVLKQALDEVSLKEGILEALYTISEAKDSGEDELPPLLDQQLTNMILLWELEPYVETAPERVQFEESLGVVSWQLENVK